MHRRNPNRTTEAQTAQWGTVSPEERQRLTEDYGRLIEMYKFYVDTALKANAFYYAITGGIVTYFLANSQIPIIRYSLLLPLILTFILAALSWRGAAMCGVLRRAIFDIADRLNLDVVPETDSLIIFLRMSTLIFGGIAVALLVLLFRTH
jgi:hypothetical protein